MVNRFQKFNLFFLKAYNYQNVNGVSEVHLLCMYNKCSLSSVLFFFFFILVLAFSLITTQYKIYRYSNLIFHCRLINIFITSIKNNKIKSFIIWICTHMFNVVIVLVFYFFLISFQIYKQY